MIVTAASLQAERIAWYEQRITRLERVIEWGAIFMLFFHPILVLGTATLVFLFTGFIESFH